jgi:hypothetical protein
MTNLQARLIASAIALMAGAIASLSTKHEIAVLGFWITIIAVVVFAVEYVRAQKP